VSHEHSEPAVAELVGGRVEGVVDGRERGLDQQPAPVGRALCNRVQLRLGQPPDHVVPELAAGVQTDVEPSGTGRAL